MHKFFTKIQFLAFLASFFVTFVVGFLVWDMSINSGYVLKCLASETEKVSSKIFTASVSSNLENKEVVPVSESEPETNLAEDKTEENQDSVITPVESEQDQLDDIAEKLDIIQQEVNDLMPKSDLQKEDTKKDDEEDKDKKDDQDQKDKKEKEDTKDVKVPQIYPKILIFETKISPIEQRYIKLYNPNTLAVDLTGWYLQRKTATSSDWSSLVSSSEFQNKSIQPGEYFLISRAEFFSGIFMSDLTLTENNSLVLKNPNGEVSDMAYTTSETPVANGGGGGSSVTYPKVLISEVQALPVDKRFIELYNPNSTDVDLTNWYLQRKTATGSDYGTCVPKKDFSGKTILANNYFIISKLDASADILEPDLTITDNNSFVFKNPNSEISDELDLITTTSSSTGQSIGRKVLPDSTEQDTGNSSADFELQTPTPKFQNVTWTEPIAPTLESIEITTSPTKNIYLVGEDLDITGLAVFGIYSDGTKTPEPINLDNITGFDRASPSTGQVLTINFGGKTTSYQINITENITPPLPIFPSIITYSISNSIISTTSPTTEFDLSFSEPVKYVIDILDSGGSLVKNVYKSPSYVTNPRAKSWDGTDTSKAVVPDGNYTVKITITDEDKNTLIDTSKIITVDNSSLSG